MTRKSFLSTIAALCAMTLVMLFTGTSGASAQQNLKCCTYTVDIAGVPADCFPINLWTRWSIGVFGPTVFNANGVVGFATPTPPPCPPAATFIGASLASAAGPYAQFNAPRQFIVNNCCLMVRIGFNAQGCLIIYIRPC